jgi:hypothetical protein
MSELNMNLTDELEKMIKKGKPFTINEFFDKCGVPYKCRSDFGFAAICNGLPAELKKTDLVQYNSK